MSLMFTRIADTVRANYHVNQTPGVVENMLAKVAGAGIDAEVLSVEQNNKLLTFLSAPPFKATSAGMDFLDKILLGVFVVPTVISAVVYLVNNK